MNRMFFVIGLFLFPFSSVFATSTIQQLPQIQDMYSSRGDNIEFSFSQAKLTPLDQTPMNERGCRYGIKYDADGLNYWGKVIDVRGVEKIKEILIKPRLVGQLMVKYPISNSTYCDFNTVQLLTVDGYTLTFWYDFSDPQLNRNY